METARITTQRAGGLEGVEVADTALSHVDGERGRLIIRGYDVERLAAKTGFEGAVGLLRTGQVDPSPREALGRARQEAFDRLPSLGGALTLPDAMDALRAAVAQLPSDASADDLIGAVATYAAAWWRTRQRAPVVPPDPRTGHAADFLRMVRGEPPSPAVASALDAYWVTVIDHGMNASTFAARVVASTASDRTSAIVAALGALKGPLHGGAPGPVLDMLDAIATPSSADAWIRGELQAGRRLMGMGHRVYRVRDPRAEVLESAIERLGAEVGGKRLELARAVEKTAERILAARHPDRPLRANVEFYTAVILEGVGLPRELFTAAFAASRVAGWCAHVDEQRSTGRLIRPSSRYIGPMPAAPAEAVG